MSKTPIFFVLLFLSAIQGRAQTAFVVTYDYRRGSDVDPGGAFDAKDKLTVKLICNTELAFNCFSHDPDEFPLPFEKFVRRNISHHASLTYFQKAINSFVHYRPKAYNWAMSPDTSENYRTWVIGDTVKLFLDYHCREAYSLNRRGDTLFAFFTAEIPGPFGPGSMQWKLPGLVLEAYDALSGQYYIATEIKKINDNLQLPKAVLRSLNRRVNLGEK